MAATFEKTQMKSWIDQYKDEAATIVFHDSKPPKMPPYKDEGTEIIDVPIAETPADEVDLAFGGRPNVPNKKVIDAIIRDIGPNGYDLHISDRSFTGYTMWEVWFFVKFLDKTNLIQYISEVFDCDDFAQVLQGSVNKTLKGVPFGTIWYYGTGWGHAVNLGYCNKQDRIYLVEPQNDVFYSFNKAKWKAGMIII